MSADSVLDGFGERLREVRLDLGMTQAELARKSGYSRHSISNWESSTSTPHPRVMLTLAALLHVTVPYLRRGETGRNGANNHRND